MSNAKSTTTELDPVDLIQNEPTDPVQAREDILNEITALLERRVALTLASDPELKFTSLSNDRLRKEFNILKSSILDIIDSGEANIKRFAKALADGTGRDCDFYYSDQGSAHEGDGDGGDGSGGADDQPFSTPDPRYLSLMMRKFLAADSPAGVAHQKKIEAEMREHNRKQTYFFYGSLMDPLTLKRVAGLDEMPELFPANISGYQTKMWGSFPALIDASPESVVLGMACDIEGWLEKDRLRDYETEKYEEHHCTFRMNGVEVQGVTFKWTGDANELSDGSFHLFPLAEKE